MPELVYLEVAVFTPDFVSKENPVLMIKRSPENKNV